MSEETHETENTETKFYPLNAEFQDWEDKTVELTFHFKKPSELEISRASKEVGKSPGKGFRNLALSLVAKEDRPALLEAMKEHPALALSIGNEIYERSGINGLGK